MRDGTAVRLKLNRRIGALVSRPGSSWLTSEQQEEPDYSPMCDCDTWPSGTIVMSQRFAGWWQQFMSVPNHPRKKIVIACIANKCRDR